MSDPIEEFEDATDAYDDATDAYQAILDVHGEAAAIAAESSPKWDEFVHELARRTRADYDADALSEFVDAAVRDMGANRLD